MNSASDVCRLPPPGPEAAAQSRRLAALIGEEIDRAGGALRFSRYMELALYAPGLGYYSGGSVKLGAAGDFVTAPEISPLFGRCLARAVAAVLADLPGGGVLELGPGSGALASEMLVELDRLGCRPARYGLLDVSAELRGRQREALEAAGLADRVEWLDGLPAGFRGVILANEVADALPCERFRVTDQGAGYLGVERSAGGFGWCELPGDHALAAQLARIRADLPEPLAAGYVGEYSPILRPWVREVAAALAQGVIVLVDYGLPRRQYYHPDRRGGSLVCHYRHRAHDDPFLWPGLQDITAWVDFTAVAEAATESGLTLDGFATQAHFLMATGVADMLPGPAGDGGRRRAEVAAGARRLLLPGEMGERFKVMACSRDWPGTLPGLTLRDLSGSL